MRLKNFAFPMLNLFIIYFLLALGIFILPKQLKSQKAIWIAVVQLATFIWFASKIQFISAENPISLFVNWIPELGLNIEFLLDGLSLAFALLVSGIGTLVFLYAHSYMKSYEYTDKFFFYLFLFSGAMLGVVLSANLIQLFIFWELTTVLSFFLISFFHEKEVARKAAFQSLSLPFLGVLVFWQESF
jgi:multicomponent Na+:H+ antiporter subunit A